MIPKPEISEIRQFWEYSPYLISLLNPTEIGVTSDPAVAEEVAVTSDPAVAEEVAMSSAKMTTSLVFFDQNNVGFTVARVQIDVPWHAGFLKTDVDQKPSENTQRIDWCEPPQPSARLLVI